MSYQYVATAQKPTSVTHSLTATFTGPNDHNLLLAKSTRFEIHSITPDGLVPVHDVNLYGRIVIFEVFRAANEPLDWLFIVTQRFQFCVLAYDVATKQIVTKAHGNIRDAIGRSSEIVTSGNIDPDGRLIGMNLYEGYFKVIPIDNAKGVLKDTFNIRLDELRVIDVKFLYGYAKPTICVLYEDCKGARHIKTYQILLKEKDFIDGPWKHPNVEAGASLLIPVPSPLGGVLVVSNQTIVYLNGSAFHVIPMQSTVIQVYGSVDKDGSRFLLADQYGLLSVVSLQHDGTNVTGLFLEVLGETSAASCLSYLDNGVVFVGSCFGDSQLIKLNPDCDETGSYLTVLDSYTNIGPITDFCVMDLDRQGQGQIVTCSGADKDGSLRVIRNGIGINEQATTELPGIKGMWALREHFTSEHDKYLLQSYVSEIRILAIGDDDEMEEKEIAAFANAKTLCCRNLVGDAWLQVTETEARVVDAQNFALCSSWAPQGGMRITVASANATQVLIATSGGQLTYLEVENKQLVVKKQVTLDYEIACVDVTPFSGSMSNEGDDGDIQMSGSGTNDKHWEATALRSSVCVVGLWTNFSVCVLRLPTLTSLSNEPLGDDLLPRSVLCSTFDGQDYLLVGLGDGSLMNFYLDATTGALSNRKRVSLGSQPISLATFRSKDTTHVFAACDRPTVIYSNNHKLTFSNVNTKEVNVMCPFHSEAFPECLALASEEELTIGTVDDIQKLHIQTFPLHEWARRIAHCGQSHTLGVLTVKFAMEDNGDEVEHGFVRLFDDQTFEPLHSFKLDPLESPCSLLSCSFAGDSTSGASYYVVGTAYVRQDEAEPHKGRILVFSVSGIHGERSLQLLTEREVKGAVYCLNAFNGKVLAGVNSKIELYKWSENAAAENEKELVSECGHHGHTVVLYMESRGDFVVVGDLMKSISLLNYKQLDGSLEEIAKDLNSNWMTAVGILDDDTYIGSETDFNLFVVQRNSGAASDEERGRLESVGEYHLGEFVNRFRYGSLVMQANQVFGNASSGDSMSMVDIGETKPVVAGSTGGHNPSQSMLFATVSGMLGVVLTIPKEQYQWLVRVQNALNKVVKGVGGFTHKEWRTFENRRAISESRSFIDGDLVESLLDLSKDNVAHVVQALNSDGHLENTRETTMEELLARVEELAQLH